ncbi:MAG: class I SAM-dependent methyltransferase [Nocardioides sp.]|nr:class I SAM-dependent methyltransferase [Nocardioides sp.]
MEPEKQQQVGAMWALGDYAQIAERLSPAAAAVVTTVSMRVGARGGRAALDVAAGTGSLTTALAAAGWSVDAVDISPALAEQGRERTAQQGLDVRWHEAPLDTVPFDDGSADLVGSSFGLIFASDSDQALGEMSRVLRPGGALAFSAWTPRSYIAGMTDLMATFMPEGPPSTIFRWGDPAVCVEWVGEYFDAVEMTTHTLPWHFESSRAASDFMFTHSPGHVASLVYAGDRAQEMRTAVEQQLDALASDGRIRIDAEYVVVSALRG